MNQTGFIKAAVGALVVIIVAAGVILPLFASAEITAGDKITIENDTGTPYTADYTEIDFTLTIYPANNADGYAAVIGDFGIAKPDSSMVALISDKMTVRVASVEGRTCETGYYTGAEVSQFNDTSETVTIEYDASEGTITYTGASTFTVAAEFVFTIAEAGPYGEILNNGDYPNMCIAAADIANNTAGVLQYRGSVTVGETTTTVLATASKYGVSYYSSVAVDWSVSLDFPGLAIKDGTTDIYTGGTPTFVFEDDNDNTASVVAQKSFIIGEASGHATSGITYTIVSILPVIILVGVLTMIVAAFISNRRA